MVTERQRSGDGSCRHPPGSVRALHDTLVPHPNAA